MQRGREGKKDLFASSEPFDAFRRFGSFGSRNNMMSGGLFGSRDPFDDPFFTRPFDSIFEHRIFDQRTTSHEASKSDGGNGLVIEELNSDEEKDKGDTECAGPGKEPSIEHPDDCDNDGGSRSFNDRKDYDKVEGTKPMARSFSFQTSKITYGGVDGTYYTSTRNMKTGSDGVVVEERKEADTTTGQATHRISRGIHDKGHSVTRKLNSDGKVDTTQTLHNLNEDELAEFEKAWKGNNEGRSTGSSDGFGKPANAVNVGSGAHERMRMTLKDRLRLPYREQARNTGNQGANTESRTSSGGTTKKIVRINIE